VPIEVKGDPRSGPYIKHTDHHLGEVVYFVLDTNRPPELDLWDDEGDREIGEAKWETRIHPDTREKCHVVDATIDPSLIRDQIEREAVVALLRRELLVKNEGEAAST
jgi:hypothetical protein